MDQNLFIHLKTAPLLGIFILIVLNAQCALSEAGLKPPSEEIPLAQEDFMPEEPTGPLTLGNALSLVLRGNPDLATFAWETRARDAQVLQASLLPNPQVGVEIEDFGGSGELASFDASETTFQLNQKIELGGKRAKRTKVAFLRGDLARWDYDVKKLDVVAETTGAFVDVLAAQERVALTEELVALAQSVLDTTAQRVKAGKVSPIEKTKANVALSTSRIGQEQALRELDASRRRLATLWGATRPEFERVEGVLNTITPVPPAEELATLISGNPDVARWDAEMEQRRAALALETSERVPDLTLGGGVRYVGDTDDHAFVVEAQLPLPLFDRNQGRMLEAQHRLSKVEQQRRAAEARVLRELSEAHRKLSAAFAEVQGLNNEVLPGARVVFDASQEGYRQGKFGYLEVLDAQRTLFEARGRHIEALTSYQKALADIERAVGMRIKDLKKSIAEEREVGTNEE